jgi:acetyl-CoA carboxylase biotin carboxylase subunit
MLAKLIVWSDNREHGVDRMLRALGEYYVGGIKTNIPLFQAILNDVAFRAGDLHTGYLDQLLKTPLDRGAGFLPEFAEIAALVAAKHSEGGAGQPEIPRQSSRWAAAGREELRR